MNDKVRRSWLLVPASRDERIASAAASNADVVVLDLAELVAEKDKPSARDSFQGAIEPVKAGGAEIFAQVDPELMYADLRACVWPELAGVVVCRLESEKQVQEADRLLGELEEERGLVPGTLEIVASVETAQGNRAAYEIATCSPRVTALTLGRAELVMDLRPEPSGEIHLYQYLMQRLVTVANAAGVTPLGAWWRAPDRGLLATPERTGEAAVRGRAIGFKGSMCLLDNQAEPLNRGFSPTEREETEARRLVEAWKEHFAGGVARNDTMNLTGVEGFGQRLVGPESVQQSRNLLDLAARCAAKEEEKAAAVEQRPVPSP